MSDIYKQIDAFNKCKNELFELLEELKQEERDLKNKLESVTKIINEISSRVSTSSPYSAVKAAMSPVYSRTKMSAAGRARIAAAAKARWAKVKAAGRKHF
jgi:methyltransferase-like protein